MDRPENLKNNLEDTNAILLELNNWNEDILK